VVSCPPAVQAGQKIIVEVWAHLERQRAEVERRVRQAIPQADSPPVIRPKGPFRIGRGTRLLVRLRFHDFHIEPPEDVILWDGEIGKSLLPGLIDMHVHPTYFWEQPDSATYTYEPEGALVYSPVMIAMLAASKLHKALMSGVTTARDTGSVDEIMFDVKRGIQKGFIRRITKEVLPLILFFSGNSIMISGF
jgi:hypothetical protein